MRRSGAARPARRTAGGARSRVAAGVSRDQGDGSRPIRGALAHAGAGGCAPALGAGPARWCNEPEAAGRPGTHRLPRRAPLDRRRAERARRQAGRDQGPSVHDHRCPGPGRIAGRPDGADHRAPFAAMGRGRGHSGVVGGDGHLRRRGCPAHPVRCRSPAVRAWPAADRRQPVDAGEDDHRASPSPTASRLPSPRSAMRMPRHCR